MPSQPRRNKYAFSYRIAIEKIIGRMLKPFEPVHHVDKNKSNDEINNLMVFSSDSAHQRFHKNPDNVQTKEIIFDGRKHKI
jgi:plasmid replication initiation protein